MKPRTQQQRREATSSAVLESACNLFGERGYDQTSLEDIAQACGTTIRPIYHYYQNKKNLFLAVTELREKQLLESLEALEDNGQPVSLADYWRVFIRFAKDGAFRQIVLIDAPNVLGRERWAETPIVKKALGWLYDFKMTSNEQSRLLLARMMVAAMIEAAIVLSELGDETDEATFDELLNWFNLINRLRAG